MDIVELAQLAELHQLQHERSLLEMLDTTRGPSTQRSRTRRSTSSTTEPEPPPGSRTSSGPWAASRPCKALAEGWREDVLLVLHQFFCSVYG